METKNTYISFQEWKDDFFQIEKKDLTEEISDKWGVSQEMLFEDTKTIRIYRKGGYLEILNNGLFTVGLDRSIYENKELEPIEKELYKWCNGELLEDTPIGLKGIKETLEERNSFEKIYEVKKEN